MARGGAASSRGRGKFKVSRGGGRHFSRDIATVDHEMENLGLGEDSDEEEESEEESSSEEEDGVAAKPSRVKIEEPEMSRAERKAMKKAGGPKAAVKAKQQASSEEESGEESSDDDLRQTGPLARSGPSRKDREAAEAAAKAEHYRKLHAAGKTDQAKGDLARLAEVRKRREAEAAKRTAAAEEAEKAAAAKREAQKLRKL